MTRRKGIIVAILGLIGGMPGRSNQAASWILEIPDRRPDVTGCRPADDGFTAICETTKKGEPYEFALEVRYKNRSVRLTGEEIMDALEGK